MTLDVVFIILEVIYTDKVNDFEVCCTPGHMDSDFCMAEEKNVDRYDELAHIFLICSLAILRLVAS